MIAVFLSVLVPATVSAYTKCAKYGQCTICDFYGPNGEYQGYIEWCF